MLDAWLTALVVLLIALTALLAAALLLIRRVGNAVAAMRVAAGLPGPLSRQCKHVSFEMARTTGTGHQRALHAATFHAAVEN